MDVTVKQLLTQAFGELEPWETLGYAADRLCELGLNDSSEALRCLIDCKHFPELCRGATISLDWHDNLASQCGIRIDVFCELDVGRIVFEQFSPESERHYRVMYCESPAEGLLILAASLLKAMNAAEKLESSENFIGDVYSPAPRTE